MAFFDMSRDFILHFNTTVIRVIVSLSIRRKRDAGSSKPLLLPTPTHVINPGMAKKMKIFFSLFFLSFLFYV